MCEGGGDGVRYQLNRAVINIVNSSDGGRLGLLDELHHLVLRHEP